MNSVRRVPLTIVGIWLISTLFWWGLAFFPTPETSPEWLVAARDVCFGTLENGLPGAAGWMVLILGPASFLLAFLVAWPGELQRELQAAARSAQGILILVIATSAIVVEGSWVVRKVKAGLAVARFDFSAPQDQPFPENYPRTDSPAPNFKLVDQSGQRIDLHKLRGETVLLTFAFAHCQTVCPVLVKESLNAAKRTEGKGLRVLIITLDPWRDTPKSLPYLAEQWKLPAHAHVLSGKVQEVTAALKLFNVPYTRDEKTGEVVHPALTYLISPSGRIAYIFNNAPAAWLSQAVERINHENDIAASRQDL